MLDLITSLHEASEERLGIAGDTEDVRAQIRAEKAKRIVNYYYPNEGKELGCFLDAIEQSKGKQYADQLRADCREEWKKRITK